ncbi:MAG: 1-deoxy-D-xylulose-5-phosphate reductoisomerase [Chloroflexi bacterium]|nr:1-deoxy-D-xylulose-5-phosphate reductoisomerase [Chloroflexota bacterium]
MGHKMKGIVVLGSTGSIGRQTLDIVRAFPDHLSVVGLSAWSNQRLLLQQAREFRPAMVFSQHPCNPNDLPTGCRAVADVGEMVYHPEVELVMLAMVGSAGLRPALQAIQAGKHIALANKEPVVIAGELVTTMAQRHHVQLLPVDSEPSAIWQCLRGEDLEQGVKRVLITASGGPFRTVPLEDLRLVTPEQALNHPTWQMGKKITIDSATMMNKAFEVMEAHWLFGLPWERIEVIIHPQSIIHSMVEFVDGSVKAQLGPPDMRLPIQHALFYPQRSYNETLPHYNPLRVPALTFEPVDIARYPCFPLALDAAKKGGTYPAVLNAANEVAVSLFLEGAIGFMEIAERVRQVLDLHKDSSQPSLEEILAADRWARDTLRREVGVA